MLRAVTFALLLTLPGLAQAACDGNSSGRITVVAGNTVTGIALQAVDVVRGPDGRGVVAITLCPASAAAFAGITAANIGGTVTLRADGDPVTSAVVREAITGGRLHISAGLDFDTADAQAKALRDAAGLPD